MPGRAPTTTPTTGALTSPDPRTAPPAAPPGRDQRRDELGGEQRAGSPPLWHRLVPTGGTVDSPVFSRVFWCGVAREGAFGTTDLTLVTCPGCQTPAETAAEVAA